MLKKLTLLLLGCIAFCNITMAQCQLNYTVSPNPVEFNCTFGPQTMFAQGTGSIQYNWYATNGQTMTNSPFFVLTAPATVTVIARDSITGCTDSTVVQSFVQTSMGVFVQGDTISCGNPTGMLTAIPTGTGANATYQWSTGQNTQSIAVTQPGVYTVTVTSGACTAVGQGFVAFNGTGGFSIFGNTQPPTCGQNNGSIFVTSNGQGVTYQWSNGATGPTIGNLAAGQYCVIATDVNGCIRDTCFYLQAVGNISIDSVLVEQAGCNGTNGFIAIASVNGTAPFTYQWSNGAFTSTITGLSPNIYSVTITDATGCSRWYEWQIGGQNNIFIQNTAIQMPTCGANNGSITVQAFGGTAPYTYLWHNNNINPTNQGLAQGVYFVTAADATGCTGTSVFTLSSNDSLNLAIAVINAPCTSNLGTLIVTATGSNLTYQWSNGATTSTIQAVPGTYTVTVTANGGCSQTISGTIGVSSSNLNYGMLIPDGQGQSYTNTINVSGNNGATISNTNPLAAVWANMEHSYMGDLTIKLICPNGASVILKNYPGGGNRMIGTPCDDSNSPNTPGIGASLVFTASATNTLLTAPMVSVTDVCTGNNIQSIPSGNYLPDNALTGFNGCPLDGAWTISFTDNLGADNGFLFDWGIQLPGACSNTNNYGTVLTSAGNNATYTWSNTQTSQTLQNVPTGTYTAVVTDGCSAITATVNIPNSALSVNITPAACTPNATNGAATIVYNGTTTPTAVWSNGQTGLTATGLATGWYSVTITNNGCVTQRNIFVPASTVCVATITGFVLNDNGNCVKDAADVAVSNVMIRCTNTVTGAVKYDFTDAQGFYQFTVDTGRYVVNYYTTACDGYTLTCPLSGNINVHAAQPNTIYPNNNFFRTATSGTHSLSTYVYRSTARPGFGQTFTIHYTNNNSAPVNATLVFTHDPLLNGFTVTSGAAPVYNAGTRTATWTLVLAANASGSVSVSCNMSQTVAVGVACSGSVSLTANGTDVCPNDNTETWTSITTNSFDPNDKQIFVRQNAAQQVSYGDHAGKDLLYQIRFQNTGTDTAYSVVIRDTLDANILDISTLKLAGASHNCTMEWEGSNILKLHFYNINLPHRAINDAGSNGHAVFTVRTKTGTAASNQVVLRNRAAIYFDYNAPIITNRVVTTLMPPLGTPLSLGEGLGVRLLPNPTDANATLTYNLVEQTTLAIVLLDINGRTLRTVQAKTIQQAGEQQVNIEVGDLAAGVYLVQFQTDKGVQTHKLVRQ